MLNLFVVKKRSTGIELYQNKNLSVIGLVLLAGYYRYFNCFFTSDPSVGRLLCFDSGTKSEITRHIVFMSPGYQALK